MKRPGGRGAARTGRRSGAPARDGGREGRPRERPRVRSQVRPLAAILAGVALAAGCGGGVSGPEPHGSLVTLDARPLLTHAQAPIASVVQGAELTVTGPDGRRSVLRAPLSAAQPVATFEVEARSGPNRFEGRVLSNDGTVLYEGGREIDVRADDFLVDLPLRAVAAVMVVRPDSIRILPTDQLGSFVVENRGSLALDWSLLAVDPPQSTCGQAAPGASPCLVFRPEEGRLAPGAEQLLDIAVVSPVGRRYRVRLGSNVGWVEVTVLVDDRRGG